MSTAPVSLAQFGQTIKAKHPEYADIPDEDLANKVLAKYPQYKDMVQPPIDLSNKQGQGTYSMADKSGKTAQVPYGQVQQAAQQGYGFADDQSRQRFNKDVSADPKRPQSMMISGMTPEQSLDRANQIEKNASLPMQAVGGVAKGAGTLLKPVLDVAALQTGSSPQDVNQMLTPQTGTQVLAKYATIGAGVVPAAVAAPGATVGGLVGGTLGGVAGHAVGQAAGLTPQQTSVLEDVGGVTGGTAGALGGNAVGPTIAGKIYPPAMKEAAAGLLQSVAHDANKVPVQLNNAGDAALSLMDWQKKTQLGPTINKFLNRVTNPKQGPLTYEEARDFYQLLGKMSADETMKIAPPVRRDLTRMVVGLKQDIGDAADQVGQAANYYKGMGDYAKAAKLQDWYDLAQKYAIRGGLAAAGMAGVGTAAKFVTEGLGK